MATGEAGGAGELKTGLVARWAVERLFCWPSLPLPSSGRVGDKQVGVSVGDT